MLARRWMLAFVITGLAEAVSAQEWHESYRDGVKALSQGQPARAVGLLEGAVAARPRPGRNVITYGTNVVERYHPYLHLAEAYLALRDLGGARSALRRSETWALEPVEERKRIAAAVDVLAAQLAPPPSLAVPLPAPVGIVPAPVVSPSPAPVEAAPTAPPTTLAATSATLPAAPSSLASASVASRSSLPVSPSPPPAPLPPQEASSLEVISQPTGVSVYLDEEPLGATDAEWGRLVRGGVAPGRHRVRLARQGHMDSAEDLVFRAGETTQLRRRLAPAESTSGVDRRLLLSGAIAVGLLAVTAWALRRNMERPGTPARNVFDPAAPTPVRGTPPGMGSPGVHRDADGVEHFGEYRLLGLLGRGGMASVFKAERRGEVIAIKRPLPAFLDEPEFLERFLREAEIGRTLNHPNIVRILERGEVEGVPFFTMELVEGETLQARIQRDGAMDPRVAARTVVQVAEALDFAHLKGVVHRDLKPSNVMVQPDGTVKVMDYGIARARRFEGMTVTGSFLGSPEYVAPEAIEGRHTDARSDLYSLGVLFYEALSGRRPFVADSPFAVLRKHLTEAPAPLADLRPGVPPALEQIVMRLLAKDPAERYASAEDLVLELRDFLYRAA